MSDSKSYSLKQLQAENLRLEAENKRLTASLSDKQSTGKKRRGSVFAREASVLILTLLAVVLLMVGNIFFWAGNTLVKTDRYVEATAPLIQNPEIQTAISTYTTGQLFQTIDVEKFTEEALPPRAAFLAPTLSTRVQQYTDDVISKLLATPEFQDKWNTAQANAHARFIASIKQNGSDGSIDLGEFYTQVSQRLKDTKLSFLAGKQLPAKVGSIQLVEGPWVSRMEKTINNIDTWRTIALILLLVLSALGVWASRNRRSAVMRLGLLFAGTMFITLILIRVAKAVIVGKVDDQYALAAGETAQTILNPLIVQTRTILVLGLIIAFVAWIGSPLRSAAWLSSKIGLLFGGKLHKAIFSRENQFTRFVGQHKRILQWISVAAALLSLLFLRLTPGTLLVSALLLLLVILAIEVAAASSVIPELKPRKEAAS